MLPICSSRDQLMEAPEFCKTYSDHQEEARVHNRVSYFLQVKRIRAS